MKKLADAGMTVISSTHGRGVLPDAHRASLRAFHNSPSVEALMAQCDFTLVAGSRLRSNETRSWTLELPSPRVQIDIDPAAASRNYLMDNTLIADCASLLAALAEKTQGREWGNEQWDAQVKEAVALADSGLREQCGAYAQLNDAIAQALPDDGILVRDITVSGSLWGSRLFRAHGPLMNIHSLAGAIGMGLPMAIGTAIANPQRKVVGLVGDGGLSLNLGSWRRWRRKG
ncbi:Cyclohexane-1,2-dione hydrolase [Raoultella terrigena]|uniref:Cyclohexane-1,2-dione hydrolase n=1 Tax=Raoultella terrigena TaxID=577 RepID=A0A4U9D352_RAOTE|nr:Cyclohexane-1,2-dione hydrolase [Raoultella terrigena]